MATVMTCVDHPTATAAVDAEVRPGESLAERGVAPAGMCGAVAGAVAGATLGAAAGTAFLTVCGMAGTMLGSGLTAVGWCLLARMGAGRHPGL